MKKIFPKIILIAFGVITLGVFASENRISARETEKMPPVHLAVIPEKEKYVNKGEKGTGLGFGNNSARKFVLRYQNFVRRKDGRAV